MPNIIGVIVVVGEVLVAIKKGTVFIISGLWREVTCVVETNSLVFGS